MQLKIVLIGKIKEKIYLQKINKYLEWLTKDINSEVIILKESNPNNILKKVDKKKKKNFFCISLSEQGENFDSKSFSNFFFNNGKKIAFIMGDVSGHPATLTKKTDFDLSLSKMTMPHEMATLVLIEQIYRAFSIRKGSKYHRN